MTDPIGTTAFLRTLARAEHSTASEDWDDAARHWSLVITANPVNGYYWSSLADARYRIEDFMGAIAAFEQAFALRDGFPSATAYRIARCHALLHGEDAAMRWLERAFDLGYHDLDAARDEDDLTSLHAHPRFRELVGLGDTTHVTRDEGWRADLRFAVREIKRRAYAPFGTISEPEFDAIVEGIERAIPNLTDHQVIIELTKLVRVLNDGHARVRPPKHRGDLQRAVPLQFYLFEEGLFITAVAPQHEVLLGAEVLAIGGHAMAEVIEAFEPIIARDNENGQWLKECIPLFLCESSALCAIGLIPEPDHISFTLRTIDGATLSVTIAADADEPAWKLRESFPYPEGWLFLPERQEHPTPLCLRNTDLPFWFQYLPQERTVYFQFSSVRGSPNETMEAFGKRLYNFVDTHEVEKLVIDMRWNHGGNTTLELPLLRQIIANVKTNRRGALFVIIGRRTFSAAQNGVNFLSHHSEAIFVGEPTGSSPAFIGETNYFELPYSKTVMNVSDLHWVGTWPGDYRIWLPPTLYAPPTFAAWRENRDPALEAVLTYREHLPGL